YMVLPLLGPSSTRDAFGLVADWYAWQQLNLFGYVEWSEDQFLHWPTLLYVIDTRANIAFRYYELGNVFEYLWVRQLYLELREFEIKR
ncbi:MAG: MlaA family lipoprotein, partial [Gammaproteobacteria bacterium]